MGPVRLHRTSNRSCDIIHRRSRSITTTLTHKRVSAVPVAARCPILIPGHNRCSHRLLQQPEVDRLSSTNQHIRYIYSRDSLVDRRWEGITATSMILQDDRSENGKKKDQSSVALKLNVEDRCPPKKHEKKKGKANVERIDFFISKSYLPCLMYNLLLPVPHFPFSS